jgi:hypothetical protein
MHTAVALNVTKGIIKKKIVKKILTFRNGVFPSLSQILKFALFPKRNHTLFVCPCAAAKCNGVLFSLSATFISIFFRLTFSFSKFPCHAAL